LKAQSASQKSASPSISGTSLETTTRKQPAEGVVGDEDVRMRSVPGPPSKKVRGSNANGKKPQALRYTGSSFTQKLVQEDKNVAETELQEDNGSVDLRHMNGDVEIDGETRSEKDADTDTWFNRNFGPYKTPVRPTRPIPRPVLKARSDGQKSTTSPVHGASLEAAEVQALTRKRPADGGVLDDDTLVSKHKVGPPSKKVKGSSQALKNIGSLFHQNWK
jgi:hypothetical protein